MELDRNLMNLSLFQEKYRINLYFEEQKESCQVTDQEAKNMDLADIEYKVDKKVTFTWNSLFQAFQDKYF